MRCFRLSILILLALLLLMKGEVRGGAIATSKHNLSTSGSGSIKSTETSDLCVFCHTPHSANPAGPIWNKQDPGETYDPFASASLQAIVGQPDGASRLCLACHDGTIAIGSVLNLPGPGLSGSLDMTDAGTGRLTPAGKLAPSLTGFTAFTGLNLTNGHPVSFGYDSALATADGELQDPSLSTYVGAGSAFLLPIDKNSKLQCPTCHDPHGTNYPKFLRMPIRQTVESAEEGPDAIMCLNCHTKKDYTAMLFDWIGSAHQQSIVANETYKVGNYLGKSGAVWEDACLACHDTHTVEGGRRLLREATDDINEPKQGGNPASEETCYLCHTNMLDSVLDPVDNEVADIETEFGETYHMPITTLEQADTLTEAHDIKNADMEEITTESYTQFLGVPNLSVDTRHVECTDCHNPHREIKNSSFDGGGVSTQGTHEHNVDNQPHSNLASGVLRGSWGVEPDYTFASWDTWPLSIIYNKRGTPDGTAPVDKEYQVCLKCHSSYAYGETPPIPGSTGGNTTIGTNDLNQYTDQAKEFNPANAGYHPVIATTGRTIVNRGITNSPFLYPWNGTNGAWVGNQTMYCSDCHGKDTAGQGVNDPTPWGPHGSANPFILLGYWDFNTGTVNSTGGISEDLCFKCHNPDVYSYQGTAAGGGASGFSDGIANLHISSDGVSRDLHIDNIDRVNGMRINCMTCHSGVPHGWKKKGLLVEAADIEPYKTSATTLTLPLIVPNSGNWSCTDCHP